jgi:hypothetical protein
MDVFGLYLNLFLIIKLFLTLILTFLTETTLLSIQRLQFYLAHIAFCLPDLEFDQLVLDFSKEPNDVIASQIVEMCMIFTPEFFANKVMFERKNTDPFLHNTENQIYDIETALSFTDELQIEILRFFFFFFLLINLY